MGKPIIRVKHVPKPPRMWPLGEVACGYVRLKKLSQGKKK